MKFHHFINHIAQLKIKELPGLVAQFKMAPELRLQYDAEKIRQKKTKKAAVLALFYPNTNQEITFLLIQRASYKGIHSAQISFPGGKFDTADTNLKETALRETFEEVGVLPSSVKIIRELTDVYIPPSNFLATPFIGFVPERPLFKKNYEVDKIIEVLLKDLLNETSLDHVNLSTSYMKNIDVPCFKLNNYVVWGATAMMLSEIKELIL